jgi:hypothetical protein
MMNLCHELAFPASTYCFNTLVEEFNIFWLWNNEEAHEASGEAEYG